MPPPDFQQGPLLDALAKYIATAVPGGFVGLFGGTRITLSFVDPSADNGEYFYKVSHTTSVVKHGIFTPDETFNYYNLDLDRVAFSPALHEFTLGTDARAYTDFSLVDNAGSLVDIDFTMGSIVPAPPGVLASALLGFPVGVSFKTSQMSSGPEGGHIVNYNSVIMRFRTLPGKIARGFLAANPQFTKACCMHELPDYFETNICEPSGYRYSGATPTKDCQDFMGKSWCAGDNIDIAAKPECGCYAGAAIKDPLVLEIAEAMKSARGSVMFNAKCLDPQCWSEGAFTPANMVNRPCAGMCIQVQDFVNSGDYTVSKFDGSQTMNCAGGGKPVTVPGDGGEGGEGGEGKDGIPGASVASAADSTRRRRSLVVLVGACALVVALSLLAACLLWPATLSVWPGAIGTAMVLVTTTVTYLAWAYVSPCVNGGAAVFDKATGKPSSCTCPSGFSGAVCDVAAASADT